MVGERSGVGFCAELVEQRRRALDIRKHEGDGAGRKLRPHTVIIRRCRPTSKQPLSGDTHEHRAQSAPPFARAELEPPFSSVVRGR